MALGATIHKATLTVSDLDRGYFATHPLVVARHPSETDERMMMRLLAFAMFASESLAVGRGLSEAEEPALVDRDLTGTMGLHVEVGLPDERAILKASGRAERVAVLAYGRSVDLWWKGVGPGVARARNLTVIHIDTDASRALATMAGRAMNLQATLQEGLIWFSDSDETVEVRPVILQSPARGGAG